MVVTVEERAIAAIVGAAVADAACQPVHWNYNKQRLETILKNYKDPEFINPSQNPFYTIETGRQSCYGDQAYIVLKSLVECNGFDEKHMKRLTYEMFGPGTEYDVDEVNNFVCKTKISGNSKYPSKGPWKHFSIKHFIKNFEEELDETGSATDSQIDSVTKIAPVVALYAGRPEMLDKVEEVVSITQTEGLPVACALFASRILERIILFGKEEDVLEKVLTDVRKCHRNSPHPLDNAVLYHVKKVLDLKHADHFQTVEALGKT